MQVRRLVGVCSLLVGPGSGLLLCAGVGGFAVGATAWTSRSGGRSRTRRWPAPLHVPAGCSQPPAAAAGCALTQLCSQGGQQTGMPHTTRCHPISTLPHIPAHPVCTSHANHRRKRRCSRCWRCWSTTAARSTAACWRGRARCCSGCSSSWRRAWRRRVLEGLGEGQRGQQTLKRLSLSRRCYTWRVGCSGRWRRSSRSASARSSEAQACSSLCCKHLCLHLCNRVQHSENQTSWPGQACCVDPAAGKQEEALQRDYLSGSSSAPTAASTCYNSAATHITLCQPVVQWLDSRPRASQPHPCTRDCLVQVRHSRLQTAARCLPLIGHGHPYTPELRGLGM